MFPVYTAESLAAKSRDELKAIARQIGASAIGDHRRKSTFIDAIIAHQRAAVESIESICDELVAEHEAELGNAKPAANRDFIAEENAIIEQIDIISDAINFAILSGSYNPKCPDIIKLEADRDALNQQLIEVAAAHQARNDAEWDALDREIGQTLAKLAPPSVWWYDKYNGTVEVDGQKRQFKAMAIYSQQPVVKLLSAAGKWIDSRWDKTSNNRYIAAVLTDIPRHLEGLEQKHKEFIEFGSDGEIWDGQVFLGYEEDRPPGKGDGRGRIEPVNEWVEF